VRVTRIYGNAGGQSEQRRIKRQRADTQGDRFDCGHERIPSRRARGDEAGHWPSREDVISTTGVVIATVAFFGVFLAIVEKLAQLGLDRLLKYFSRSRGRNGLCRCSGTSFTRIRASRRGQGKPGEPCGRLQLAGQNRPRADSHGRRSSEVRGGKKVVASRMSYPGYVLVEMDLDENTWHIVRNTPRVTGFVGFGHCAAAAFGIRSGRDHQPRAHTAGSSEAESGLRTQ